MNEPALNALTQRLDRLERAARWWKILGTAAIAVLGAVLLLGAGGGKQPDEVRAKWFVVVDEDGKERARLGVLGLALYDKDNKEIFTVSSWRGLPRLVLRNGSRSVASLALNRSGSASLDLSAKDGERTIWLEAGRMFSSLAFYDEDLARKGASPVRLQLDIGRDGAPSLTLFDRNHQARLELLVEEDAGPSLRLFDKDQQTRALLGPAALEVTRTGMKERRPESSLVLFDKDGKVIWKAPAF